MITCLKCGKENQDHYKFCLGCGAELPRAAAA
ncbi:MAG: zinc-ribbon domain-containing protein, partial [Polyangiaceae bacterium]